VSGADPRGFDLQVSTSRESARNMKPNFEKIGIHTVNNISWWRRQRINFLRLIALFFGTLLFVSRPILDADSGIRAGMDAIGLILLFVGVFGRFWSIIYIGGRKSKLVLDYGPYSICRHPLYLFSTIATIGIALTFGSIFLTAGLGFVVFFVLYETARHEERYLLDQFNKDYLDYAVRVPRIIPNFSLWKNEVEINLDTRALYGNFRDALVFLFFIPLSRFWNWLREEYDIGFISLL
jgi:protein-S-isoprenylcysteine O-methyltransferase Ste14